MWDNDIRNSFDFHFSTPDGETVNLNFKAVSIEQVLTKFEDFLHGCGYKLQGQVKIVNSISEQNSKKYAGTFNSMPAASSGTQINYPTSGGITKEQIAALQTVPLQTVDLSSFAQHSIQPLKNEDILHFGV